MVEQYLEFTMGYTTTRGYRMIPYHHHILGERT
jgi:hypothetical protein